ncbi:MAG: heme exporter protein CcmD [Parvibaculum sp.]|nr:heme exporter protein CcmD [Parvibaculum sp.]
MAEFFAMGGYAGYVWSAYGVTAIVIIALVLVTGLDLIAQRKQLDVLESDGARKRAPARPSGSKL